MSSTVINKKKAVKPRMRKKASSTSTSVSTNGVVSRARPRKPAQEQQDPIPGTEATNTATATDEEGTLYGFRSGSDVAVVLEELLKGGDTKHDVSLRIAEKFKNRFTRGGKRKPVSTIMNQVETQMKARGFTIEAKWQMHPPEDGVIGPRPKRKTYPRKPASPPIKIVMPARQSASAEKASTAATQPKRAIKPKPKPKPSVKTRTRK